MSLVVANASGPTTVTLPSISVSPGIITIKDSGSASGTNIVTILPAAGNTFETGTSYILNTPSAFVTFVGNTRTLKWKVIGSSYADIPVTTLVPPASFTGNLSTIITTLNVTGHTTLNTLSTFGQAAFYSSMQIQGSLSVFSTLAARNIDFTGLLTSNGNTFSGAPAGINSAGNVGIGAAAGATTLLVTGSQSNTGTLDVSGNTTLTTLSTIGQAAFYSSMQVQGGLSVFSTLAARNIDFTGLLTSNGLPFTSGVSATSGFAQIAPDQLPLTNSRGICFDPSGNMYVADSSKYVIYKITPTGVISLFAGTYGVGVTPITTSRNWTARATNVGNRFWNTIASSTDGTKLVAAVSGGFIYTSTDSGVNWTPRMNDTNRSWQAVASSADGTNLVAVVLNGFIYTSTNSGVTWTVRLNDLTRQWKSVASSVDGRKLVAVGGGLQIYISTDYGVTWSPIGDFRQWSCVASSSDGSKLVAGVMNGRIWTSTDSGANWALSTTDTNRVWKAVASSADGSKLVALVEDGKIYTSTDSGANWMVRMNDADRSWQAVASSADGNKLVAVVFNNYIYTSTDAGVNWVENTDAGSRQWCAVASSSDGNRIIAGTLNGNIYTIDTTPVTPVVDGSAALFGEISNICYDSFSGSIMVASVAEIRAINLLSRQVTTLAGSSIGYADGTGVSACFNKPAGICSDGSGALYIADCSNNNIRKLTFTLPLTSGTGVVTTMAGSTSGYKDDTGTLALFNSPSGIVINSSKTLLWVADTGNHVIRQITLAGVATTFAGNNNNFSNNFTARAASLNWTSVASSSDGTKLVASAYGDTLYTSTDSGATWTTRYSSRDWYGVASSANGDKLVAVAYNNDRIYTSTDSGVSWTPRATSLNWVAIASSSDGTKLVAAVLNGSIYTSTDSGATWIARNNVRNWIAVASSADGNKLVALVNGGQIWTSTDSGENWTARDSSRGWKGVASSVDGTNLVAVVNGGRIYTSTDSGLSWTARESSRSWFGVTSSSDGSKLVATVSNGQIYTSTDFGVNWTARQSSLNWTAVAASSDANKIVALVQNGRIYTLDGNGLPAIIAGSTDSTTAANVRFNGPQSLAIDASNNLYVTEYIGDYLRFIDTSPFYTVTLAGNGITNVAGVGTNASMAGPAAVALDPYGTPWVVTYDTPAIFNYNLQTGYLNLYFQPSATRATPYTLQNTAVSTIVSPGIATGTVYGSGYTITNPGGATYQFPNGVLVDSQGNVYVADQFKIRKITPSGLVTSIYGDPTNTQSTTQAGIGATGVSSSIGQGMCFDNSGNMYVSQYTTNSILRVNLTTCVGTVLAISGQALNGPNGMLFNNNILYVINQNLGGSGFTNNASYVVAINLATNVSVIVAGSVSSTAIFNNAFSMCFDATKTNIYVSNFSNGSGNIRIIANYANTGSYPITPTTFTTSGLAGFAPVYITSDSLGNFYVSGSYTGIPVNRGIIKITSAGVTSSLANTVSYNGSSFNLNTPQTLAVDSYNNVYFAERALTFIGIISPSGTCTSYSGVVNTAGTQDSLYASSITLMSPYVGINTANPTAVLDVTGSTNITGTLGVSGTATVGSLITRTGTLAANTGFAQVTNLPLANSRGICFDPSGNMYVNSAASATIYKITPQGETSLLAGNYGVSGTRDGTGSAALFVDSLQQMIYDSYTGGIVVANTTSLRLVSLTGVVTTIASGFNNIYGVCSDGAGTFYVTEHILCIVIRVVITSPTPAANSGTVTTIAGSSGIGGYVNATGLSAQFWNPAHIVINNTKNIVYIADANNYVIRQMTIPGYVVTTLAGRSDNNWIARDSSRNWSAVASSADGTKLVATIGGAGGQIYTSTDSGATWIARDSSRQWNDVTSSSDGTKLVAVTSTLSSTGDIYTSTDSGATWIARNNVRNWIAVASSSDGTKLVALQTFGQIWISTDGGINWAARESSRGWADVASSADGNKLVAVSSSAQIYTSTDAGATWTARDSSRIWRRVASSADGNKLVACVSGGFIYTSTDSGVTWTPRESSRQWTSVASSSDGTNLVATVFDGLIYTSTDSGISWAARETSRSWSGVASSADGSKLVALGGNTQIYTLDISVNISLMRTSGYVDSTTSTSVRFSRPICLAIDSNNNLFMGDYDGNYIRYINVSPFYTLTLAGSGAAVNSSGVGRNGQVWHPHGVALDPYGNPWIVSYMTATIFNYNLQTGYLSIYYTPATTVPRPINIQNTAISTIVAPGIATGTVYGSGFTITNSNAANPGGATYESPNGVLMDSQNNLYVCDNRRLRKITPSGLVTSVYGDVTNTQATTQEGTAVEGVSNILYQSLCFDNSGNVYVSQFAGNSILRINLTTGVGTNLAITGQALNGPNGMLFNNNILYVINENKGGSGFTLYSSYVVAINLATNVSVIVAGSLTNTAIFNFAFSMCFDATKTNIYVSNYSNGSGNIKIISNYANTGSYPITPTTFATSGLAGLNLFYITSDNLGNFYASGTYTGIPVTRGVIKITSAGVASSFCNTVTLSGATVNIGVATGLAVDPYNNVYFADANRLFIGIVTPGGSGSVYSGSNGVTGTQDSTYASSITLMAPYVGINTANPTSALHVNGNTTVSGNVSFFRQILGNTSGYLLADTTLLSDQWNMTLNAYTSNGAWVVPTASIGTSRFTIQGAQFTWYWGAAGAAPTTQLMQLNTGGLVLNSGNYTTSSDNRIKKNISTVSDSLEIVNKLSIVSFDYIDSTRGSVEHGLIAQELQDIYPISVYTSHALIPTHLSVIDFDLDASNTVLIKCSTPHDLVVGDRVKLDIDITNIEATILEIPSDTTFIVNAWNNFSPTSSVSLYGKYVDDFLSIDKAQFGILAAGACQTLSAQVTTLQSESANQASTITGLQSESANQASTITGMQEGQSSIMQENVELRSTIAAILEKYPL